MIPSAQQIDIIENLNSQELDNLLMTLLEKKGFQKINKNEKCIIAFQSGLLGISKAVFITLPFKMGGAIDSSFTEIAEIITDIRNEETANSVFIYSKLVITNGFQKSLNKELNSLFP